MSGLSASVPYGHSGTVFLPSEGSTELRHQATSPAVTVEGSSQARPLRFSLHGAGVKGQMGQHTPPLCSCPPMHLGARLLKWVIQGLVSLK